MKKTKTTYGVFNLIEWHAVLRLGKAAVKVPFVGGSITTQGVTPATHTTEDPIIQFAIEHSSEFKSGKIKIVRRVKLNGEVEIEKNLPRPISAESEPAQEVISTVKSEDDSTGLPDVKNGDENAVTEQNVSEQQPERMEERQLTEMEFDNNDDAKDFLESQFGYIRSKLRNRADIIAAGEAQGIRINFA